MKRRNFLTALGVISVSAFIPKILLGAENDVERKAFSSGGRCGGKFIPAGLLNTSELQHGPYAYYTGSVELECLTLEMLKNWKVAKGFPRKHKTSL